MLRHFLIASLALGPAILSANADIRAARTLRIGSILMERDLHTDTPLSVQMVPDMVGKEVRRIIYVGQPVQPEDLGPPTLVRRNEIVVMSYKSGSLGIRTEGRAMSPGGKGETIEVMNLSSRLTVRAMVVGVRSVEVVR